MNYTIECTKPSSVKVHDFPVNTKHISYKISHNRLLELNFYLENLETQRNFWDKNGSKFMYDSESKIVTKETEGAIPLQFDMVLNTKISINSTYQDRNLCLGTRPLIYGHSFKLADDQNDIYLTNRYPISNVSDGEICWGYDKEPEHYEMTPFGIINNFIGRPFNSDYCTLNCFYDGAVKSKSKVLNSKSFSMYHSMYHVFPGHKVLCSGFDAIMLIDASQHPDSFFKMICAGFRSCEESSTLMMIPLMKTIITHDSMDYNGYSTPEDRNGKQWFVTDNQLIIGQMDT